ncbi:uncharacterized protein LOC135085959 [Ostrinia nubilalis]|uniref:uncharacterized protein LOC135085959 n=1 Tax=Ostrinia nubilalis TaxID=29057 RepID=UPI0030823235
MTAASAVYALVFFTVIGFQVTAWTIDLPEVRKFYFERFEKHEAKENLNNESYDNINGNSVHNAKDMHVYDLNKNNRIKNHGEEKSKYADSFNNYESYMVRKVQDALHNGSVYVDGLRLSIERYIEVLENCSRLNLTSDLPPELTSPLSIGDFTSVRAWVATCRRATESSEHVRRLAELALWTTRRLQDVAFTAKYSKDDSMEENELLLRLAWYLDKLAHLTGYDPNPEDHTTTARPPETTRLPSLALPLPNFLPNISAEVKNAILECLRVNSSEPATQRCALPIPPRALRQIARVYNLSDSSETDASLDTSGRVPRRLSDDTSLPSLEPELLLATDNKRVFAPILTPVKSVQKRSVTDSVDPLVKVLKYYAKHKIWVNSNPLVENFDEFAPNNDVFDVKNDLHPKNIQKRSLDDKPQVLNKPQTNPLQDLSKYIKGKPSIHYNINRERFRSALDAIHSKKVISNNKIKKLKKIFRYRRSPYEFEHHHHEHFLPHIPHDHVIKTHTNVHYEPHKDPAVVAKETVEKIKATIDKIHTKKVILHKKIEALKHILRSKRSTHYEGVIRPRISDNPQPDLSYYVKNRVGTNFNRDLAQAASVRASLENAFQRGNILVVQRYGANYNPAVLNPFYAGVLQSMSDS